jgi:hypothetical protein
MERVSVPDLCLDRFEPGDPRCSCQGVRPTGRAVHRAVHFPGQGKAQPARRPPGPTCRPRSAWPAPSRPRRRRWIPVASPWRATNPCPADRKSAACSADPVRASLKTFGKTGHGPQPVELPLPPVPYRVSSWASLSPGLDTGIPSGPELGSVAACWIPRRDTGRRRSSWAAPQAGRACWRSGRRTAPAGRGPWPRSEGLESRRTSSPCRARVETH